MADLRLSGAWVPTLVHGWDETAEALIDGGKPWPENAVITDLRIFVNETGRVPTRRTLMERWKWTRHRVTTLLADEERWHDPAKAVEYRLAATNRKRRAPRKKGQTDQEPTRNRPGTDQEPTSPARANLDNRDVSDQEPTRNRPGTDQESAQARCRTRNKEQEQVDLDPPSGPPTLPGISPPPANPDSPEAVDEVLAFWGQEVNPALGKRKRTARSFGAKVRKLARARLADPDIGKALLLEALQVITDETNELGDFHRSNARAGQANYLTLAWFLKDSERIHAWANSHQQSQNTQAAPSSIEQQRAQAEENAKTVAEKLRRAREIKAQRQAEAAAAFEASPARRGRRGPGGGR